MRQPDVTRPRISVVGTGYLGATHAACLAELGLEVLGVDIDPVRIRQLEAGRLPFHEPGLDVLLERHVTAGGLRFTTDLREAADFADVHFVCVGTPQRASGQGADLRAVLSVVANLAQHATRDCLVVGKSTVPVGTAAMLRDTVATCAPPSVDVGVAWNPEFLREGHAVRDTLRPDRLVFGVTDLAAEQTLRRVYADLIAAGTPVHVTDLATAELAKVAANAFLATKISFINAVADVSDRSGADVVALADILGDDARIGRGFLDAGVGFGGGCLPKDVRAFAARAAELGAGSLTRLLREVDDINDLARQRTVRAAEELCGGDIAGRRVAVLGAAFKPLSDDVRDSPALAVAEALHAHGAEVRVYDPQAGNNARAVAPALTYVASADAALSAADVVLHLTDWPEFRGLDPQRARRLVRHARIVDARNRLDARSWREAGWTFRALGRKALSLRSDRVPSRTSGVAAPSARVVEQAAFEVRLPDALERA